MQSFCSISEKIKEHIRTFKWKKFLKIYLGLVIFFNLLALYIGTRLKLSLPIPTLICCFIIYKFDELTKNHEGYDYNKIIKKAAWLSVLYLPYIYILAHVSELHIDFKLLIKSVIFLFLLNNGIILLVNVFKNKYIKLFIASIFLILYLSLIIANIGYFYIYHELLGGEAIAAIAQTTFLEAEKYLLAKFSIGILLGIGIISLSIVILLSRFLIVSQIKLNRNLVFIVLLLIIGLLLTRDNSLYRPIKDFKASLGEYSMRIFKTDERARFIADNIQSDDKDRGIYVLVIGESYNKIYSSAYGYTKADTTPWMRAMKDNKNFILFDNVYASYPQTVPAVTKMITAQNQYSNIKLEDAPSIIEMAKAAGYKTIWLSNQGYTDQYSYGITTLGEKADYHQWINYNPKKSKSVYFDMELLNRLKKLDIGQKTLIVLHLKGSHMSYVDRYPEEFAKFNGLSSEKVNEYANTIAYNDYFLNNVFDYLKTLPDFQALLYVSDHGEDVYKLQDHNPATYNLRMITIPMFVYLSDNYIKNNYQEYKNLEAHKDYTMTNDLVYNMLMSMMHLKIDKYYEADNDILNNQYDGNFERFRTLNGQRKLEDWHDLTAY